MIPRYFLKRPRPKRTRFGKNSGFSYGLDAAAVDTASFRRIEKNRLVNGEYNDRRARRIDAWLQHVYFGELLCAKIRLVVCLSNGDGEKKRGRGNGRRRGGKNTKKCRFFFRWLTTKRTHLSRFNVYC